jgi:Tfp pilus assembly protein PilX
MRARSGIRRRRRGVSTIVIVGLLVVVELVIVGMVLAGGREQDLTARRLETVRAFYAAEAGVNMAVRELMEGADEDGDGATGTISDDGNDANDPSLGAAQVVVTAATSGGETTVTSKGRSGQATRELEAVLE